MIKRILALAMLVATSVFAQDKPNVLLILTDDQGYGDFGFTGNHHVKTPTLDALAKESFEFKNFYVSPVCAPTRSSIMTGRQSLRTGITDTYNGGAIMSSSEVTMAELLKQGDYKTGMYGKWHLGDNYPYRPQDQGFDESVIHLSGGMGQVGDITTYFKKERSYFDPVLWHNGEQESYKGYCTDIFTDEAIKFIESSKENPFFCFVSYNAPHTPLQLPESYYNMYKDIDPSTGFSDDLPIHNMSKGDKEAARKVYGMVTNIDDNIKRLFDTLDKLKITKETIVIFLTDNGPKHYRYTAGLRGKKSKVYRGGIQTPMLFKYPKKYKKTKDITENVVHMDLFPTIAELCNVPLPKDRIIDGRSFTQLLNKKNETAWEDQPMFWYWTRKYPELYNNISLQHKGYKLVGYAGYNAEITDFELYDINTDPYEQKNIVSEKTAIAVKLKKQLDSTFQTLIKSPNLVNKPRIIVGVPQENPIFLSRNDAGGQRGIWNQPTIYGKWDVTMKPGTYNFKFKFENPVPKGGMMSLELAPYMLRKKVDTDGVDEIEIKDVVIHKERDIELIPFYEWGPTYREDRYLPFWVEVEKID